VLRSEIAVLDEPREQCRYVSIECSSYRNREGCLKSPGDTAITSALFLLATSSLSVHAVYEQARVLGSILNALSISCAIVLERSQKSQIFIGSGEQRRDEPVVDR